jgi:hypothetical protein
MDGQIGRYTDRYTERQIDALKDGWIYRHRDVVA